MRLVVLGLSITSSWGNGHATTYRALLRALAGRGHEITFLERDVPWYAEARDLPEPPFCATHLYASLDELKRDHTALVAEADAVIVGSYVPEGIEVGAWVQATAKGLKGFYDIDTPVTLKRLGEGDCAYLSPELIPGFDLYLSFTGGPTLKRLEEEFGSPRARALYCAVDADAYRPLAVPVVHDLGYLGTYSPDRQPKVEALLLEPARQLPEQRFCVAGAQYPASVRWPGNVEVIEHLPPPAHPAFYCGQRFTLNVTRADMVEAGWSPSVRLFEAAACGVPILSDPWPGLDALFPYGEAIFIAETSGDVLALLATCPEAERRRVAHAARARVLKAHTASARAAELEACLAEAAHG